LNNDSQLKAKKSVWILMTGTFISQLIPFLFTPVLTRLFTPQEFGVFGLYFSISMICSVIITGRYEMTIMLPEKKTDAFYLLILCFFITTIISLITLIVTLIFKQKLAAALKCPQIENWLLLLPFTLFAIGTFQALSYWNNREENYKLLATSRVLRSVGTSFWSVLFGAIGIKNGGLILGDTLGQLFTSITLFFRTYSVQKKHITAVSAATVKAQALRYKQFPLYNVPSGLLEKASGHSPVILLTYFFGDIISGFFSFSQRIISAPASIVARAYGDIFRQEASVEFRKNGNCKILFLKTLFKLSAIAIAPFTILFLFSPQIFTIVFGQEWYQAGVYTSLMTPMFFLQFIVSPLSSMFLVAEKQVADFLIQFFLFITLLLSFVMGYRAYQIADICIILFTIVYSFKYIIELYLSFKFSKGKVDEH
jgi:O-antigen/teichoic acid export membrane protein